MPRPDEPSNKPLAKSLSNGTTAKGATKGATKGITNDTISLPATILQESDGGNGSGDGDGKPILYQLAINLADLDRVDPLLRGSMVAIYLDLSTIICMDKNRPEEEAAVVFKATIPLLQSATVCDIIRNHDRLAGDIPTKLYIKRDKAWDKIPGKTVLTDTVRDQDGNDTVVLNTKFFVRLAERRKPQPIPHVMKPAKKVTLGRKGS